MADAPSDLLAETFLACVPLLDRFLDGFDDANATRMAPAIPNHLIWTYGHLALVLHRAAERFESPPAPLPAADFVTPSGDDAARPTDAFDTESVAVGSTPTDDPTRYPRLDQARAIFVAAVDRFALAVRHTPAASLAESVSWGSGTLSRRDLVARQMMHLGTHTGQLLDLRRALGLPRVIG